MNFEILVNKDHLLDSDYIPNDLIITDQNEENFHKYKDPNLKPMIHKTVFEHFLRLQEDALKDGLNIILDSGYRSFDYQQKVFEENVKENGIEHAKKYVAIPGASEHQTGLAIDFAALRNGEFYDDIKEETIEAKWMKENAYKYGFILRYPKEKENITGYSFEPWHYRYVGFPLSKYLTQNNLTLEEYHELNDDKI